jgi:hypothetical protein
MAEETPGDREWAIARVVESNEEAILVAGYLDSNGIPAKVESLHVDELPVNLGALGEVRVRVPAGRLEEAQALLAARDREAPSDPEEQAEDGAPAEPAGDAGNAGNTGDGGQGEPAG